MRHVEYNGKAALVRYRGGAVGEEIIEDCSHDEPVRIQLGAGEVPPGVDEVLYDMSIGEQRRVVIPAEKAYGIYDPSGVQVYPRWFLPCGDTLQEGDCLSWKNPVTGAEVPVRCIKAAKDVVTIDFNHLYAGKDLDYWFELVDVVD